MTIEENLGLAYSRSEEGKHDQTIKRGSKLFIENWKGAGTWSGGSHFPAIGIAEWRAAARRTDTADVHDCHTNLFCWMNIRRRSIQQYSVMNITERIVREPYHYAHDSHNMKQALEYGNQTRYWMKGKIVRVLEGRKKNLAVDDSFSNMYDFVWKREVFGRLLFFLE